MAVAEENRGKQVVIGASILIALGIIVPGLLLGWRSMPGLLGETVGTVIGIMTTPFFMEASFVMLGFFIVLMLNNWRRAKEGDDFVYLEQVEGPDAPKDLPDQAKWAVFREKPLEFSSPTLLEQAEGAFAIGDFAAAAEWIGAMSHDELKRPDTLELRWKLAKATGREDLAERIENERLPGDPGAP